MKWMRKAAVFAVVAVFAGTAPAAVSASSAQTQPASPAVQQCVKACNDVYMTCAKTSPDELGCRRRWGACKRKCQPPAPPPPAQPAPPKK